MPKDKTTAMLTEMPSVKTLPKPSSISFTALPGEKDQVIRHARAIAEYFRCCTFSENREGLSEAFQNMQMQGINIDPNNPSDPEGYKLIIKTIPLLLHHSHHDDTLIDVLDYEGDQSPDSYAPPEGLVSAISVFDSKMSWMQSKLYRLGQDSFHRAACLFLSIVNYLHDLNQARGPDLNAVILQANQLALSPKGKQDKKVQSVHDAVLNNFRTNTEKLNGLIAAHKYFTELFFSNKGNNNFYPLFQLFVQGEKADPASQETLDKIQANIQDLHTFFDDLALFIALTEEDSLSPAQLDKLQTAHPHAYERAVEKQHKLFSDDSLEDSLASVDSLDNHTDSELDSSLSHHSRLSTESSHSESDASSLSSRTYYSADLPSSRSSSIDSTYSDDSFVTARDYILPPSQKNSSEGPVSHSTLDAYTEPNADNKGVDSVTEHPKAPPPSPRSSTSSFHEEDPASLREEQPTSTPTPSSSNTKSLRWLTGASPLSSKTSPDHAPPSSPSKNTWTHTVRTLLDNLMHPFRLFARTISSFFHPVWAWISSLWTRQEPPSSPQEDAPGMQQKMPNASLQKSSHKSHSAPATVWSRLRLSKKDPEEDLSSMDLKIRPWQEKEKVSAPNRVGFRKILPPKKSHSTPAPTKKK